MTSTEKDLELQQHYAKLEEIQPWKKVIYATIDVLLPALDRLSKNTLPNGHLHLDGERLKGVLATNVGFIEQHKLYFRALAVPVWGKDPDIFLPGKFIDNSPSYIVYDEDDFAMHASRYLAGWTALAVYAPALLGIANNPVITANAQTFGAEHFPNSDQSLMVSGESKFDALFQEALAKSEEGQLHLASGFVPALRSMAQNIETPPEVNPQYDGREDLDIVITGLDRLTKLVEPKLKEANTRVQAESKQNFNENFAEVSESLEMILKAREADKAKSDKKGLLGTIASFFIGGTKKPEVSEQPARLMG